MDKPGRTHGNCPAGRSSRSPGNTFAGGAITAPDPLAVRVFEQQVNRHEVNARNDFASVQGRVQSLTHALETLSSADVGIALGAAKNLARDVADLISDLAALATLKDVAFLVSDSEAKP
ncbi:hypothetical protein ACFOY4_01400 [Actinomadura syzygii]|uniref:Uncharacterized protein n=1 Tax=Actinomadura syzygii TaxID=1427538 RepID=A0A5D0TTB9_9ACTN|nr:hypothetical protein [Actinomadura syzygii]TYC08596.1 hypothetical protein FXF65_37520 [Actinomadura syzygii]